MAELEARVAELEEELRQAREEAAEGNGGAGREAMLQPLVVCHCAGDFRLNLAVIQWFLRMFSKVEVALVILLPH